MAYLSRDVPFRCLGNREASRGDLRLLQGALPGCDVHDPHDSSVALLYHQSYLSLSADLRRLVPRILPTCRVR